jgi:hypothetical protein
LLESFFNCIFAAHKKVVKNSVLYFIIFLFSTAICYETIEYCYQNISELANCEHHDIDCEENKTESKSSEKSEKEDVFDDMLLDHHLCITLLILEQKKIKSHHPFISADYSQAIYSPPELILL